MTDQSNLVSQYISAKKNIFHFRHSPMLSVFVHIGTKNSNILRFYQIFIRTTGLQCKCYVINVFQWNPLTYCIGNHQKKQIGYGTKI